MNTIVIARVIYIEFLIKQKRNFHLLSFGDEAEDEEQELVTVSKEFKSKAKSAHDIGDPTLLSKPAKGGQTKSSDEDSSDDSDEDGRDLKERKINDKKSGKLNIETIKSKLKKQTTSNVSDKTKEFNREKKEDVNDEEKARYIHSCLDNIYYTLMINTFYLKKYKTRRNKTTRKRITR